MYCKIRDHLIARREQTTSGVIIAHLPSEHNSYKFEFKVQSRTFIGTTFKIPSPPDSPQLGKKVTVFYDPDNPSNSEICSFEILGEDQNGPIIACLGAFVGALFLMFHRTPWNFHIDGIRKNTLGSPL